MEHPNFQTPRDRKPLNRSRSNLIWVITLGTSPSPHMQTLVFLPFRRRGCIYVKLSSSVSIFYPLPRYFFTFLRTCTGRVADFRGLWLKRRDSAKSMSFSACERKKMKFSAIFRKNTRNSLFPQCKNSISNNSSSIKDRAVQFAYSRSFLAMADRIV